MKKIVLLTGRICTGKSTAARFLDTEFGCATLRTSDVIKQSLAPLNIYSPNREDYIAFGAWVWERFGNDALTKAFFPSVIDRFKRAEGDALVVIDGIRHPDEISACRQRFDTFVIGFKAPIESRLSRYNERSRDIDAKKLTVEELITIDKSGPERFAEACLQRADVVINADYPSSDQLRERVRQIIESMC